MRWSLWPYNLSFELIVTIATEVVALNGHLDGQMQQICALFEPRLDSIHITPHTHTHAYIKIHKYDDNVVIMMTIIRLFAHRDQHFFIIIIVFIIIVISLLCMWEIGNNKTILTAK